MQQLEKISVVNTEANSKNPYPGLRPFRFEESHLYFGRKGQIDEVIEKLLSYHFNAVVGTSGIGKSSFMYCGLLPNLNNGLETPFSDQWQTVILRPGLSPLKNLARELATLEQSSDEELTELNINSYLLELTENSNALRDIFLRKNKKDKKNYLLFIDQFEELFRFRQQDMESADEASSFVKLIASCVNKEYPIYVVLTMRSDFVGDCSQYPLLTSMLNQSQFLIPQMTREEKREAILGPAGIMGARIDDKLVQQILNDVGDSADALPVMQHALMRSWDFWQKSSNGREAISQNHYETIGGMKKALSIHANEAFNELNDKQRLICEKLFKTITEKGDDGRAVRRPTKLGEIANICTVSSKEVVEVIDFFRSPGRTLLMPPYNVVLNEDSMIDISHESLMRNWVMLSKWVDEESESVKLYLRLSEAAEMHQQGKAGLWRPPDLQLALNWLEEEKPSKTWGLRHDSAYERTMLFLDFSKKEYEREQLNKEKVQRRRLIAARIVAGVLGFGALIAFLFFLYGEQQRVEAMKQTKKAEEQKLLADKEKDKAQKAQVKAEASALEAEKQKLNAEEKERQAQLEKERAEQATIIAEAEKIRALRATKDALYQKGIALDAQTKAQRLRMLSIAKSMAIKSTKLVDVTQQGLVAQQAYTFNKEYVGNPYDPDVYDAMYIASKKNGNPEFTPWGGKLIPYLGHGKSNVRALVTCRTCSYVYSAGSDGKVIKWDLYKKERNDSKIDSFPNIHKSLALSPDKKFLAVGGEYPYVKIYDLQNNTAKVLKAKIAETWFLAYTYDNKYLISGGTEKKIYLWDQAGAKEIHNSTVKINAIATSPSENVIAIGKQDGSIQLYDITTGQISNFASEEGLPVVSLSYSENGRYLASGNEKGVVKIWDMKAKATPPSIFRGHTARVNYIRFNKDNTRLATGSFDRTVRLWNFADPTDLPIVLHDHDDWVWSIEFSPDGQKVLAGCKDGKIRLWPTTIDQMADVICNKSNRNMTNKEWEQFVGQDVNYQKTCATLPVPSK